MRGLPATNFCILLLVLAPRLVESQHVGAEATGHVQESGDFLLQGGATAGVGGHGFESEGIAEESLEQELEAAEEEGEHEEEEEITDVEKTTSYLLIGFMVTNFVMLSLVIYPDANIRSYTWKMMSSTISIYLAVLLNNAIRDFALHAFLDSRCAEGSECDKNVGDQRAELVIRFALFLAAFALTNILCYAFQNKHRWMYASQVLSGHIAAFAGIELFVNLAIHHRDLGFLWGTFAFASISLVGFRATTRTFRDSAFGPEGTTLRTYMTVDGIHQHEVEIEEWREAACEAEDDGCSIFMSYMVKVLVMTHVFGIEYHKIIEVHTRYHLGMLLIAGSSFVGALFAFTFWRRSWDDGNRASTSAYMRCISSLSIVLAMSMSWLSLEFFKVFTMVLFPNISEEFDKIISAAILTVFGILGIILLDCCADKVDEAAHVQAEQVARAALSEHHRTSHNETMDRVTSLERAMRSIINGFALAIGLSWEKAFHAALEVVVETQSALHGHCVTSQVLLALVNCLVIMPVWLSCIVPMANKSVRQHEILMAHERQMDLENS
mmetsp:Transcript_24242/g.60542  ORF Transcript_24242/g.60542 Transcript_24242/m.60542 type:complete len:552 (-) Transcript_24242:165-1820(-)